MASSLVTDQTCDEAHHLPTAHADDAAGVESQSFTAPRHDRSAAAIVAGRAPVGYAPGGRPVIQGSSGKSECVTRFERLHPSSRPETLTSRPVPAVVGAEEDGISGNDTAEWFIVLGWFDTPSPDAGPLKMMGLIQQGLHDSSVKTVSLLEVHTTAPDRNRSNTRSVC